MLENQRTPDPKTAGGLTATLAVGARLTLSRIVFFLLLGILNLLVVYHFSVNTWVNFKLFGTLGLTIIFIIGILPGIFTKERK